MGKRLVVQCFVVTALAVLTACAGATSIDAAQPGTDNGPVGLAAASSTTASIATTPSELLNPEFGCGGPGHIEYGLVNPPAAQ